MGDPTGKRSIEIRAYRPSDREPLFAYWRELGQEIPYLFDVSARQWQACLLADRRDGERTFQTLKTDVATEGDRLLGFVQYGRPQFAWNESGKRDPDPQIGVVRQLYFRPSRHDAGEALLARGDAFIDRFDEAYAFYHALGMSCTAHHGKLHGSQAHVHELLRTSGFQVEHENAYYVMDIERSTPTVGRDLRVSVLPASDDQWFRARQEGDVVGTAEVRYLDRLTGGATQDTAYLTWFGIEEARRGEGLGTAFLSQLVHLLVERGYRSLHTDTARDNGAACALYEKVGFEGAGLTRSYVRA
jgi:ribosomal protein S18 acetylase RimI-like enzyme